MHCSYIPASNLKTDLYLALQSEIEKVPKHDVTIVMGDLNAKVGNDNTGNERVMGKYGMVTSTTMANA
jgi:hypothetical protein